MTDPQTPAVDAERHLGELLCETKSRGHVIGDDGACINCGMKRPAVDAEREVTRKTRHTIMRTLQRADWALQEDDSEDALKAVLKAARMTAKLDAYLHRPDGLSRVIADALYVTLEDSLDSAGMGDVLGKAHPLLVLADEQFRGCDYGM